MNSSARKNNEYEVACTDLFCFDWNCCCCSTVLFTITLYTVQQLTIQLSARTIQLKIPLRANLNRTVSVWWYHLFCLGFPLVLRSSVFLLSSLLTSPLTCLYILEIEFRYWYWVKINQLTVTVKSRPSSKAKSGKKQKLMNKSQTQANTFVSNAIYKVWG